MPSHLTTPAELGLDPRTVRYSVALIPCTHREFVRDLLPVKVPIWHLPLNSRTPIKEFTTKKAKLRNIEHLDVYLQ